MSQGDGPQRNKQKAVALCVVFIAVIFALVLVSSRSSVENPQSIAVVTAGEKNQQPVETRPLSYFKASPKTAKIKPESIIVFSDPALACLERDAFQKAIQHAIKGEETKLLAMMIDGKNENGKCIVLPPGRRFKVISSEYNSDEIDVGLLEIVGEGNMSGEGAWTFSSGAKVVR